VRRQPGYFGGETALKVAYLTDVGKARELNEDSLYVNEDLGLFIIADGMGGHNAGEIASKMAVTLIAALIEEGIGLVRDPPKLVQTAVTRANEVIVQKSAHKPGWSEMGTTVVLALLAGDNVVIAHVGDSRAYMIENGDIRQITEDHTFVADWLRQGLITKEEARTHAQRHGLTEALGATDEVEIDLSVQPWDDRGCLLLCSDGLTDMIEDDKILDILTASTEPAHACRELVDAANRGGGRDNITVVLVCRE
jgi:PPM family protein phosphatase